jgi:cystathionine beta-lyase/cystathionine gamma-synthase
VLGNMPENWLNLTTHRLDIYNEKLAKVEFLDQLETLFKTNDSSVSSLNDLPTAYDYIRLGHPLSSLLEWGIAKKYQIEAKNVITFSSRITPILSILRKNLLDNRNTQIVYTGDLPSVFNADVIHSIYNYTFELKQVTSVKDVPKFDGTTIFVSQTENICDFKIDSNIDFFLNHNEDLGSVLLVNGASNEAFISEIQHVRRRETIAMTPVNSLVALKEFVGHSSNEKSSTTREVNKSSVIDSVKKITGANSKVVVASSGLSMQYAIVMGLIHDAVEHHKGKNIKIIVPTNCYGGTNDQARRVAACIENVEVVDLLVDGGKDMVQSIDSVLDQIAKEDAVPFIIAEIPTNPRVEVPEMMKLSEVLSEERKTANGEVAIEPVFILDQTFCPNTLFLGDEEILSSTQTLAYVSGSKFPSGGKCTAGYCVANSRAARLMDKIDLHLTVCDNEATDLQYQYLAEQLPSMKQRIADAYKNTREFVTFIEKTLPTAKINFVSEELASQGFTPSVFSLDLPTKGNTDEEREAYKRELNLKLIDLMITKIPNESKYCVSYGQLRGCYWTIPATSTQGTTEEGHKDYIARVALSHDMDLELHKKVFKEFVDSI